MRGLSNKHVVITGGARGIGRAVAERLAAEGAHCSIADLKDSDVVDTAREISSAGGGKAEAFFCDVRDLGDIERLVSDAAARNGDIHGLVNNAGIIQIQPFFEVTREVWSRTQEINVAGSFFMMQAVARHMVDRKIAGRIVNLASEAGRRGSEWSPHYGASKAAVISITRSAALALIRHGISVNAVAPGLTQTSMWDSIDEQIVQADLLKPGENKKRGIEATPAGRAAVPEDIARAVCYLLSDESEYVVGHTLDVNGGRVMS